MSQGIKDICRLCPVTVNLIYVFNDTADFKVKCNWRDIIFATIGIKISEKDEVSQKVCSRCCNITLKMFNFRQNALKHDKELKERLNRLRRDKIRSKEPLKRRFKEITPLNRSFSKEKDTKRVNDDFPPIHPTVAELYRGNQNLKLPTVCLSANISPIVCLTSGQVDEFCKRRKLCITELYHEKTESSDEEKPEESAEKNVDAELDKPQFIKSLGLTPKPLSQNENPMSVEKQTTLYICNICNSVQYNPKDLRKHQNNHLICQFCRCKFRTIEKKAEHLENSCVIKNAMIRPPFVELAKIEFDRDARRRFRKAFYDFPNLYDEEDSEEKSTSPSPATALPDIIEILSDEEESPLVPIDSGIDVNSPAKNVSDSTSANCVNTTSSIIRPYIKIKNNDLLNKIDTKTADVKITKDLLAHFKPHVEFTNSSVQTDLPQNPDIKINRSDFTCELVNLKNQLLVYKVPLVIKNGQFNVCYMYDNHPKKVVNKHYWKDLPVIDIKKPVPAEVRPSYSMAVTSVTPGPVLHSPPPPAGINVAGQLSQPQMVSVLQQQLLAPKVSDLPRTSVAQLQPSASVVMPPPRGPKHSVPAPPLLPGTSAQLQPRPSNVEQLHLPSASAAKPNTLNPVGRPNLLNSYAASLIQKSGDGGKQFPSEIPEDLHKNIRVKNVWELQ